MLQYTYTLPVNQQGQVALTLEQLWSGLMLRVMEQTAFTVGLERVDMLESSDTMYRRALHFGAHVVHDRVQCVRYQSIEFVTDATETAPSGRLLMTVVDGGASLRFDYTTQFPEASNDEEEQLLSMIKAAYIAADTDMIRIIRELVLKTRH